MRVELLLERFCRIEYRVRARGVMNENGRIACLYIVRVEAVDGEVVGDDGVAGVVESARPIASLFLRCY
jgi:hypothetical protein